MKKYKVRVEISARHIHLTKSHLEKLFGKKYELKKLKELSQIGEFASTNTLKLKTKKSEFLTVRVLGPTRKYTQIEISASDSYRLGLNPPTRMSGDLDGTAGATLVGPKGSVILKKGVIMAHRHLHASPEQAKIRGLRNGQKVNVEVSGEKGVIFKNVKLKIHPSYDWSVHLDVDECNGAGLHNVGNVGYIIK